MLLGRISASVEARIPDGFVTGVVTASPAGLRFSELRGATSLPALAALLPVRGMRGQASVALEELVLENGWPATIVGELKLAGLETAPLIPDGSGALLPLGDYTITFLPAPAGALAAQFVDNGGPLEVAGTVNMDDTRTYALDALVEPRAGAPESLVEGLEDHDGRARRRGATAPQLDRLAVAAAGHERSSPSNGKYKPSSIGRGSVTATACA